MPTSSARALVEQLHHAGFNLLLAPAGGLAVAPSSQLTPDLRALIRNCKPLLVDWLRAANDGSPDLMPPDDPANWKELASAYWVHHFRCQTCICAGRGARYGRRCDVGLALWRAYSG